MKLFSIFFFLLLSSFVVWSQEITIVIDPGHGGSDPGHLSKKKSHLEEKEINLIIAKKIGTYLQTKMKHVNVKYTRTDDSYPSLEDRVKLANNEKCDYFISIHCNGSDLKSTKGTESHVHDASSKQAMQWATLVEKEFRTKGGRTSRGVKTGEDRGHSLEVLKYTNMTSILVECGFMTNIKEANYLNTVKGQDVLASAIYRATKKLLIENHPKIGFIGKVKKTNSIVKKKEDEKDFEKISKKEPSYKIRLMSSIELISTANRRFKTINHKVSRINLGKGKFKYIYQIGPFSSLDICQKELKEVKNQGFEDAFLFKSK